MRKVLFISMLQLAGVPAIASAATGVAQELPAPAHAATVPAPEKRSIDSILDEYQRLNAEVRSLVRAPEELLDPVRRKTLAEQAVPKLNRLLVLADELATAGEAGEQFAPELRSGVNSVLCVLNDAAAIARLTAQTKDSDAELASQARCALMFGEWVRADGDPTIQARLLDEVEALAKASPEDDHLAVLVLQMGESAPATPRIRARAVAIATKALTGEMAQQIRQQFEADAKLSSLEGKPLTIEGKTRAGEDFSSDAWKGKVILVDFAVTAWPPSRANSERLAEVYQRYHAKGLEIVTISCDESLDDLTRFLSETPRVTWTHLYDATTAGWHPIAKELSVTDPSTAILIDRQGIVVTTDARGGLEKRLAELFGD